MPKNQLFIPFLFLFFLSTYAIGQSRIVILEGSIKNRPLDTLLLAKSYDDLRYSGVLIPILKDSSFSYTMEVNYLEEYQLVFQSEHQSGAWMPVSFFPQAVTIRLTLYPSDQIQRNKYEGSPMNNRLTKFYDEVSSTFGEAYDEIFDKMRNALPDSEEMAAAQAEQRAIDKKVRSFQFEYFKTQADELGISQYLKMLREAERRGAQVSEIQEYQNFWVEQLNPEHPLIIKVKNQFKAFSSLKVGGDYIDFITIDERGKDLQFSTVLNQHKFTLLDLWAPWCRPCISKSKKVAQNYKTLNILGLNVFSVIGGIKEESVFHKTKNRHAYPWSSHMEISDQHKIWEKYGISGSGGRQFLFNQKGQLLAIDPSVEQIIELIK